MSATLPQPYYSRGDAAAAVDGGVATLPQLDSCRGDALKAKYGRTWRERTRNGERRVLVPRKSFLLLKEVWDDYDTDRDLKIDLEDFRHAFRRLMPAIADTNSIADLWQMMDRANRGFISINQFFGVAFPHLSKADVRRAVQFHMEDLRPPAPVQIELKDLPDAQAEIKSLFRLWDKSQCGVLRLKDLESPLMRCGFDPSTLFDTCAADDDEDSKITEEGLLQLLGPSYVAEAAIAMG